jgi:alpha-beta hydrolase superfamily lysophospholipase
MKLTSVEANSIFLYRWLPEGTCRGVVQIVHGLAEHAGRYARLAAALNSAGYAVYAHDQRGHGHSAATFKDLGFFSSRDGWRNCLDDLWRMNQRMAADYPGVPIALLGHSMGSFLVQQFITEHGVALAGAVLSGSDGRPARLAALGRMIARIERVRLGPHGKSALIHAQAFGTFNRSFEPTRTPFDWLTRDPAEVDSYMADPFCGFRPSIQLWIDLLDAMGELFQPGRQARIPKDLPVYIISGACDPVGDHTRGVRLLLDAYRGAGLTNVAHHFYPGARHELFNEINRDEVTSDLIGWLKEIMGG